MGALKQGVNDFYSWCCHNGQAGQQLLAQFTGITENGMQIAANEVSYGSSKKLKWKCAVCGCEWFATVFNITHNKSTCPHCLDIKKGVYNTTLLDWCKANGFLGEKVMKEWVGLDKNNKPISIGSVTYKSDKEVKWKCIDCGKEYVESIRSITEYKSEIHTCSYCEKEFLMRNREIKPDINLRDYLSCNGDFGRQIMKEWVGLDENNKPISMDSIKYFGHNDIGHNDMRKKVKWKCGVCGKVWTARIIDRLLLKTCPFCKKNLKVGNLKNWCLKNGDFGKRILKAWTGLSQDGQAISIENVAYGSKKRMVWKCNKCGKNFQAPINWMVYFGDSCLSCRDKNTTKYNE